MDRCICHTNAHEGKDAPIPSVKIIGGGLAGLAAAAKLGEAGFKVDLHESKPYLGGRASSFPVNPANPDSERIDNCQHVLLRCCTALLDFYQRCGVQDKIAFHDKLHLVLPGGITDTIQRDPLPVPFHLARSFISMNSLKWADKLSLFKCLRAAKRDWKHRTDLDSITFTTWLHEHGATPRTIRRFWKPFIVSALNEESDKASALPALQVFVEGLLGDRTSYEIGIPVVPLDELYSAAIDQKLGEGVHIHLGSRIDSIDPASQEADYYVSAVPFERVSNLLPDCGMEGILEHFSHSPITGVHLWFEKPITHLEHAMLLDRQIQWIFHKGNGYYLVVISASRDLLQRPSSEIVKLALDELTEYFPAVIQSKLNKSRVIKEVRATYSAVPGLENHRPSPDTRYPNVFLAGDWTASGWPATMEGAVRSGYQAAESVIAASQQVQSRS